MTNGNMAVPRMSWAAVCARRLERHGLSVPMQSGQPADVVSAICGAHAQVMSAAELSIGLRLTSATRADIRHALWAERSLIKTFGPRGTVHILATKDLPLWTGALSATPPSRSAHAQDVRLSPNETDAIVEAIAIALEYADLTIDELTTAIVARVGTWAGDRVMPAFNGTWPRWRQAMSTAAHRGVLCFGPNRGRNTTYTSPHRFLPGFRSADGQTALAEMVLSYLYAYGPATPQQFAQWFGAPRQWATELFDSLSGEIQPVELAGTRAFLRREDGTIPPTTAEEVRLLPYFDAYAVGCHPRALLFPDRAAERALAPSGQAGNYPVLLVGGTVAGVWHQRRTGRKLAITVEPFRCLTLRQRRELDRQAARVGAIQEGEPEVTVGAVTAGAHA